jgi:hypothetical protein
MQAIELDTTISMQGAIALPASFKAIYGRDARMILLLDDALDPAPAAPQREQRQANLRQALTAVAQAGIFARIDDASAWQRDVRADRPQPGRDD